MTCKKRYINATNRFQINFARPTLVWSFNLVTEYGSEIYHMKETNLTPFGPVHVKCSKESDFADGTKWRFKETLLMCMWIE